MADSPPTKAVIVKIAAFVRVADLVNGVHRRAGGIDQAKALTG